MKPDTDRKILCIADTGIGIDPADLPRIFDNGYTGLNGRYDMKASGIGLYLCRCIADMLGITLTAVSELGKGSVFMLDLTESKNKTRVIAILQKCKTDALIVRRINGTLPLFQL